MIRVVLQVGKTGGNSMIDMIQEALQSLGGEGTLASICKRLSEQHGDCFAGTIDR